MGIVWQYIPKVNKINASQIWVFSHNLSQICFGDTRWATKSSSKMNLLWLMKILLLIQVSRVILDYFPWLLFAIISFTPTNLTWPLFYFTLHTLNCSPLLCLQHSVVLNGTILNAWCFLHAYTVFHFLTVLIPPNLFFVLLPFVSSMLLHIAFFGLYLFLLTPPSLTSLIHPFLHPATTTSCCNHVQRLRFALTCSVSSNYRPSCPPQDSFVYPLASPDIMVISMIDCY